MFIDIIALESLPQYIDYVVVVMLSFIFLRCLQILSSYVDR